MVKPPGIIQSNTEPNRTDFLLSEHFTLFKHIEQLIHNATNQRLLQTITKATQ
jgi:hypothetical protein